VVDDREAAAQAAIGPMTFDFRQFEQWLQQEMTFERLFARLAALLRLDSLGVEYRQLLRPDLHRRVCHHLGVAHRPLTASLRKQNADRIATRFTNPEEVRAYLETIGRPHWGGEELGSAAPTGTPAAGTGGAGDLSTGDFETTT
jgi:hypothetical protein